MSDRSSKAEAALKDLADELGDQAERISDQVVAILYDEISEVVACSDPTGEVLQIESIVFRISGEYEDVLLETALTLCLHGGGTGGASLGLDEDGRSLILRFNQAVAGLDAGRLGTVIAGFIEKAREIRSRLSEAKADAPTSRRAPDANGGPDVLDMAI